MAPRSTGQDHVLLITRVVAAVIVPFLVLAFAVLFPVPTDTKQLFAWQIKPVISPMILGSVYLGGAYFFVRVIRAAQWHTVAGGFLPVGTFASLMGIATILHWNKFLHSNVAFWLWVGLYFTTPFLVFGVFIRNQREYDRGVGGRLRLSPTTARVIAFGGGAAVITSAFLYLFPYQAIDIWPWKLTPLTARMLGAIFALGLAGLGTLRETRWSAARVLIQVEAFMLLLIVIAGVRAYRDFDPNNPLTWALGAGFVATAAATATLYVRMEATGRTTTLPVN